MRQGLTGELVLPLLPEITPMIQSFHAHWIDLVRFCYRFIGSVGHMASTDPTMPYGLLQADMVALVTWNSGLCLGPRCCFDVHLHMSFGLAWLRGCNCYIWSAFLPSISIFLPHHKNKNRELL